LHEKLDVALEQTHPFLAELDGRRHGQNDGTECS
jgi:hypothetical protein